MIIKEYVVAGKKRKSEKPLEVICPYDGEPVGNTWEATDDDVEEAAARAAAAADGLARTPVHERPEALRKLSALVRENAESLSEIVALEAGKNVKEARAEVDRAAFTAEVSADETSRLGGEVVPMDVHPAGEGRIGIVRRFPRGPVLGITPFNFPINLVMHKVAPAIAVGAPIVIKPASATPLSALALAELALEAGVPLEAVSVLPMAGPRAEALVGDDRFAVLTFTGSSVVGWKLKNMAGRKMVCMELGGNAAVIVHEDADVDYAAGRCAAGGFGVMGQSCISVQRIYVHGAIYDEFAGKLVGDAEGRKLGHPLDDDADHGSLITEGDAERVDAWLAEAMEAGAKVLCGGTREETRYRPTVMENVPEDAKISAAEVFAPLVVLHRYDDFADAVARTDAGEFGLQAGVFANDIGFALYAHENIRVGGVVVGDVPTFRVDNMPYGGSKKSGIGREGPRYAVEEYTEPRLLVINREGLSS
ncbi:MAG: aldehyde dehydrogenase family protein [Candidatus Coatesbacteria bacterium]|nr:MAG: aldehyde dehydrogenase family protein [Candidatus Coatesbacteria bacterium]